MSQMLDIVMSSLPGGLVERFADWGNESFPLEPREFTFHDVRLTLSPIPEHIRALLPQAALRDASALSMDPSVVNRWRNDRLSPGDEAGLRDLFGALSSGSSWAVSFEATEGRGHRIVTTSRKAVFDAVDGVVRRRSEWDVTILVPDEPA